jgi:hypothetical protein
MDWVTKFGNFSPAQIKRINYCRLFFNVVTVADIVNEAGTHVGHFYWWARTEHHPLGKCKLNHRRLQAKPKSTLSWTLWRKALALFAHPDRQLDTPLGDWLLPADKLRMAWPFYFDPNNQCLYQRTLSNQFKCISGTNRAKTTFATKGASTVTRVPNSAVPAPVFVSKRAGKGKKTDFEKVKFWKLRGPLMLQQNLQMPQSAPESFDEYIGQLEEWDRNLFASMEWGNGVTALEVAELVTNGEFLVASDGAADPITGKASFGWLLTDIEGNTMVACAGPVYGFISPVSYRAEAYGVLSPTRFLKHLQIFFKLPSIKSYKHYCDNKSVIGHCKKCLKRSTYSPNDTLASDWDVLHQITDAFRQAAATPKMIHVKSHQDQDQKFEDLSLKAQLNCRADWLAGDYMQDHPEEDWDQGTTVSSQFGTATHCCWNSHLQNG